MQADTGLCGIAVYILTIRNDDTCDLRDMENLIGGYMFKQLAGFHVGRLLRLLDQASGIEGSTVNRELAQRGRPTPRVSKA